MNQKTPTFTSTSVPTARSTTTASPNFTTSSKIDTIFSSLSFSSNDASSAEQTNIFQTASVHPRLVDWQRKNYPVVFYLTRTHMQLQQVVAELKRTHYRQLMTLISSRQSLCINTRVKYSQNPQKECIALHSSNADCPYRRNYARLMLSSLATSALWTAEEISRKGFEMDACPYYATQALIPFADIVFPLLLFRFLQIIVFLCW